MEKPDPVTVQVPALAEVNAPVADPVLKLIVSPVTLPESAAAPIFNVAVVVVS